MRFKNNMAEVVVPKGTSTRIVQHFIDQNREWLKKQYLSLKRNETLFWPRHFLPGESVCFQGEKATIDLDYAGGRLTEMVASRLIVTVDPSSQIALLEQSIREEVIQFLKRAAQSCVEECAEMMSAQLKRWPRSIRVRTVNSRWGSCGIHEDIYINWVLILAPKKILEYVVLHECCHLFYRSHGVRFWQKVASIMPEYKQAEHWLRKFGSHLSVPM